MDGQKTHNGESIHKMAEIAEMARCREAGIEYKPPKKVADKVDNWIKVVEQIYSSLYQYRQVGAMGYNPLSMYDIEKYIQYEGELAKVIVSMLFAIDPIILNFEPEVKKEEIK